MTSQPSSEQSTSQQPAQDARERANARLGQWVRQKYCIESLLGVGGMAAVYAARHRNGSRYALKVLHTEFAREEGVRTRFLREGYVANKVDHPGAVRILDDDITEQGEPFLVMELLEGETLQRLWKRHQRKVPTPEALRIGAAILDILEAFHHKNIIHRDLKPANIFICHDSTVKLLDFGVAQLREAGEAMTRAGTALGTPSFMSPEQAMGKSDQLDGRSDVFSLGATLYAVCGGKRLHSGKGENEAFIRAATQPAPSLARIAPELDVEFIALVDRSLQWDRRRRFASAADMRDACLALRDRLNGPTAQSSDEARPAARGGASRSSIPTPASAGGMAPGTLASHSASHSASQYPSIAPERASVPPQAMPGAGSNAPGPGASAPPAGSMYPSARVAASKVHPKQHLIDVFERFEKSLSTLRHYGIDHPEGLAKVRVVHRAISEALREDPECLGFRVHPFCFSSDSSTVWEPAAPNDQVPYALASTGVESIRFKVGITEEEICEFIRIVVVEPQLGLNEGDIGAALWEASFAHIETSVRDDLADANARAQLLFFSESDEVESELRDQLASALQTMGSADQATAAQDAAEIAALALGTETASFRAASSATAVLQLAPAVATALRPQLTLDEQQWEERFFDTGAEVLADVALHQDPDFIYGQIHRYLDRRIAAGHWEQAVALIERLRQQRTTGSDGPPLNADDTAERIFTVERVRSIFAGLQEDEMPAAPRADLLRILAEVLPLLPPGVLGAYATMANELGAGELREIALLYVDEHVREAKEELSAMLDDLEPVLAQRMLALLTQEQTPETLAMLQPLLVSPNPALRCEATVLLARSPEELGPQLLQLLRASDTALRLAALRTMSRHQVRHAGPGLVGVIEDARFARRGPDERNLILETLYALNPRRAESLLMEILEKHGLVGDEDQDRRRIAAAEVLGQKAETDTPLSALENAGRLRPWNSQALRTSASTALAALKLRLAAAQSHGATS